MHIRFYMVGACHLCGAATHGGTKEMVQPCLIYLHAISLAPWRATLTALAAAGGLAVVGLDNPPARLRARAARSKDSSTSVTGSEEKAAAPQ